MSRICSKAGHVILRDRIYDYTILVGKPNGKQPLETPRRRWENKIKLIIKKNFVETLDWIDLAKDRKRW
jgi:hypothetical protein